MSVTYNTTLNPGIMKNTKVLRWKKMIKFRKIAVFEGSLSHAPFSKYLIFPETGV